MIAPRRNVLPEAVDALVHVGHELVKVGPALVFDRARFEEQVHQHGLAAADLAMDVDALDRLGALAVTEQAAEQILLGDRPIADQPLLERRKRRRGALLRRIALDLA